MATSDPGADGANPGWGRPQRRWTVLVVLAGFVVAGVGLAVVNSPRDDSGVDVATGQEGGAPTRWLPSELPEGVELAWVDDLPNAIPPPGPTEWTWNEDSAYDYGFHVSGTSLTDAADDATGDAVDMVQLTVAVYLGRMLPAATIAADLENGFRSEGDNTQVEVREDSTGRDSVTFDDRGTPLAVFDLDGVVFRVAVTGFDATTSTVSFEELDAFIHSFRLVDPSTWRGETDSADVAPPYDRRDPTVTLVEGEGWRLDQFGYRPRSRVGTQVADLIVDGSPATPDYEMPRADADLTALDFVQLEFTEVAGGTVAWGLAPPDVATIRFSLGGTSRDAATMPFASNRIFAIELSEQPLRAVTFDADGRELDHPTPLLPPIE